MRWNVYGQEYEDDLREFLNDEDEFEDLRSTELIFNDGRVTGVLIELDGGRLIHFGSRQFDDDGNQESLCVSLDMRKEFTEKKENENV